MAKWNLKFDVTQSKPFASGGYVRVPTGDYELECTDTDVELMKDQEKHPNETNTVFYMRHPGDSEYAGAEHRIYLQSKFSTLPEGGLESISDPELRKQWSMGNAKWRAAFEAFGVKPEYLDSTKGEFSDENFGPKKDGTLRRCTVHIETPPEGELDPKRVDKVSGKPMKKLPNVDFIARRDYEVAKKRAANKPKTAPAGATATATQTAQPAVQSIGALQDMIAAKPATVAAATGNSATSSLQME